MSTPADGGSITNNSSDRKYDDMERERIVQLFASLLSTTSSEPSPLLSSSQLSTTAFGLLGAPATCSRISSSATVSKASFLELLAKETTTLCTIPSFDICSENDDLFQSQVSKDPTMPPPATVICAQQQGDPLSNSIISIPEMKASVFDSILPPGFEISLSTKPSSTLDRICTQQTDDASTNGLSTKAGLSAATTAPNTHHLCSNEPAEIDGPTIDRGASNMAEPITWTRSSSTQIPMAVVRSLSSSFSSLVDHQMKATALLLLKQSIASASPHARSRLLTVLSPASSIRIHSITTSFDATSTSTETIPNPSTTPDQSQPQHPQENLDVVILPLIFRATVSIMVGPQTHRVVTFKSTGKIQGSFKNKASYLLNGVEVSVDTYSLITTMVEEARKIVAEVVEAASAPPPPTPNKIQTFSNPNAFSKFPTSIHLSSLLKNPPSSSPPPSTIDTAPTNANSSFPAKISLQSFASLKLFDKLRSSDGSSSSNNNKYKISKTTRASFSEALTLEKNRMPTDRSVTWNPSVKDPSEDHRGVSNKRRKIIELQPQLLSSKSFGKPHASLFESNRNATFAEFGRAEQTCATYLACQPTTSGHSQSNSLFRVSTTTNISTDVMQRKYSSTSFSDRHVSKKNDLLASFTAASRKQQQPTNQVTPASYPDNCMDFSDLRGFLGDALGAPSFELPKQQSPSSQTTKTSDGKPSVCAIGKRNV